MFLAHFLANAAAYPKRPALQLSDRTLTYEELAELAAGYGAVISKAVPPGGRAGIYTGRNVIGYAGILGCFYAGVTFLPLNPTFPLEVTRSMIDAGDLSLIIADESVEKLEGLVPLALPVFLPQSSKAASSIPRVLDARDLTGATPAAPVLDSEGLAYIMFTSGSTGRPKGVPIGQANLAHFLDVNRRRLALTPEERFSQIHELTFDASLWEMLIAWSCGGCVCVIPELELLYHPAETLGRYGVSAWFSVPSMVHTLQRRGLAPRSLARLRWSFFGGEPLTLTTAQAWKEAAPASVIENLYGPTELTMCCASYRWDDEASPAYCCNGQVPIGQLFEGLDGLLIDEDDRRHPLDQLAPGAVGELCVAGPQTFDGYWRDPLRTSESLLVSDAAGPERTYYRTGDIVRVLGAQAGLTYLGRRDDQVKVRGVRVELGEVVHALEQDPRVTEAHVVPVEVRDGSAEGLVVFVSGERVDTASLMARLRSQLVKTAVPSRIIVLDEFPKTSTGKIDRLALQRLSGADAS